MTWQVLQAQRSCFRATPSQKRVTGISVASVRSGEAHLSHFSPEKALLVLVPVF